MPKRKDIVNKDVKYLLTWILNEIREEGSDHLRHVEVCLSQTLTSGDVPDSARLATIKETESI